MSVMCYHTHRSASPSPPHTLQAGELTAALSQLSNASSAPVVTLGPGQPLSPLHFACQHGRLDVIELLTADQHSCVLTDDPSPLQLAVAAGHTNIVQFFIDRNLADFSTKNASNGANLLHIAAANGRLDIVRLLVEAKVVSISAMDGTGNTALHHACLCGSLSVASYLTSETKHPLVSRNKKGETALHLAAMKNCLPIVEHLVDEKGCDPAITDGRAGVTPLHLACKNGALQVVEYLTTEKQCDPQCRTAKEGKGKTKAVILGRTPLHYASFKGHLEVVEFLVSQSSCDPNCSDSDGITPFHLACQESHEAVVAFLLHCEQCGDARSLKALDGKTLLHCAALGGSVESARLLLEEGGCDGNSVDSEGRTPLHYAARKGHTELVQYLIQVCAVNVNCPEQSGITPLHLAAQHGNLDTVKFLSTVAQCSCTEENGHTPLHLAAYKGHLDVVKFLASDKHVSVSTRDKVGRTPVHHACQMGNLEVVRFLSSLADCDCTLPDKALKASPLHLAAGSGHMSVTKFLIEEKSCHPHCCDKFNSTPVHRAASQGHLDIVQYLVKEKQCSPLFKNKFGNSALHLACQKNQAAMVKLLLSFSTENLLSRNQVGRMPLDLTDNVVILSEFLKHGVDPSKGSISTTFAYLKHWDLLSPSVKVCLLGDSGSGKTTLLRSLHSEGFLTDFVTRKFRSASSETAGVIPTSLDSKYFGKVTLYDFSGHHDYQATNAAVLDAISKYSSPLFLIVVDLRKSPDAIKMSIANWTSFIVSSVSEESFTPNVVIIGSHDDHTTKDELRTKAAILEKCMTAPQQAARCIGWFTLDCQKTNMANSNKLRQFLTHRCEEIRSTFKPCYKASLLFAFIQYKFGGPIAVMLGELQEYIANYKLPDVNEVGVLCHTCEVLHARGYVLYLKDDQDVQKSWLILNQEAVFSIHSFQKQIELSNQIGLVPLSQLKTSLGSKGFNLELVIPYFLKMCFCARVADRRTLYSLTSFTPAHPPELHLFFPHLIAMETPTSIWKPSDQWECYFAWALSCVDPSQFLGPRFLQVLLLKLATAVPFNTDPNSSVAARKACCTLWKTGVSWLDSRGFETLVEVIDAGHTAVIATRVQQNPSPEKDLAYSHYRSFLLREARAVKSSVCPQVEASERLLDPSGLIQHPFLPPGASIPAFSMRSISSSLFDSSTTPFSTVSSDSTLCQCPAAAAAAADADAEVGGTAVVTLERLLCFEPRLYLGSHLLVKLSQDDLRAVAVDDATLDTLAQQLSANEELLRTFCKILQIPLSLSQSIQQDTRLDSAGKYLAVLQHWRRREGGGTFAALKTDIDQFSILTELLPSDHQPTEQEL